ncbi:hypothetical protein QVD17_37348 [Tagetes erecta]|uniref:Transposase n=1 Tax=Tagetes erecta TaxID=13708 RepID=A0AAD8NJZ0_TARER|nr:hypothetical protein QVD17_37348 [Tagetes erecta]
MDRDTWMYKTSSLSSHYRLGVQSFVKAAEGNREKNGSRTISCPCNVCKNFKYYNGTEEIEFHLLRNGFMPRYHCWSRHGESIVDFNTSSTTLHTNNSSQHDDQTIDHNNESLDHDYQHDCSMDPPSDNLNEMLHDMETNMGDAEKNNLQQLFEDAEKPLYSGSSFNKLDAVLKLFKLKSNSGWSDTSFNKLLVLLHDMLPEDNELPISTYQAKKMMCPMGLEVERIHACPNNCILYRNMYAKKHKCVECGASRYKRIKDSDEVDDDVEKNGPPAKILWYLPIIPRLKRLFSNEKEAKLLRWHSDERVSDGKLRHVADSPQWRTIDRKYRDFGKETRNIRFGLSSDGINPFGNMSSRHSTWPVLLCIYNLPPWLCMKRKYIMMSLLIQGPRQPGNDIDVYLSPLIDDLKTLWESGVDVYDAYMKEHFRLRAMLFCTINDFPAYGNLSGFVTKGRKACPICEEETTSVWLKNCKKTVYMGHRRFLPEGHRFRNKKDEFDGEIDTRLPPPRFDAWSRVENLDKVLGKRYRADKGAIWKKKSIFWNLPYWRDLTVRHCLDVMHIEKNVCESLLGLLLNIPGKTKDGVNVRKDMQLMNIRPNLAPKQIGERVYLPPACYNTSKEERKQFCQCLHDIKVPSSYSANIKRLVSMKDSKLIGMKSHDCHVLMTHMIPIAIRGLLPDHVRHTITKLCLFFNNIHSKVIDVEALDQWQNDIRETLCELEMYFPPSFFDIMVHLVSHIVQEIKACGPVFLRYMYPFERYMSVLKGYVRNRNRPEGSIIKGYTSEEVTQFCEDYMEDVSNIVGVPKSRHSGRLGGQPVIGIKVVNKDHEDVLAAHLVVLKHMTCLAPYVNEHMDMLRSTNPGKGEGWYINTQNKKLAAWMKEKVTNIDVDETVKRLGRGPDFRVKTCQGYDINGYTFYTNDQDKKSVVQNSGVTIIASTTEINKQRHDTIIAKKSYYGVIQEIWELDYHDFTVPVFKCKWVNNGRGVEVDKYGFTLVDLTTSGYKDEPFVLATHVTQVFFVNDPSKPSHHIVLQGKRRILGVDNVNNEDEYDHFDDLPPCVCNVSYYTFNVIK